MPMFIRALGMLGLCRVMRRLIAWIAWQRHVMIAIRTEGRDETSQERLARPTRDTAGAHTTSKTEEGVRHVNWCESPPLAIVHALD
jgi:hypothetical protein